MAAGYSKFAVWSELIVGGVVGSLMIAFGILSGASIIGVFGFIIMVAAVVFALEAFENPKNYEKMRKNALKATAVVGGVSAVGNAATGHLGMAVVDGAVAYGAYKMSQDEVPQEQYPDVFYPEVRVYQAPQPSVYHPLKEIE